MYVVIVSLLVACAFGGFCLRAHFRQRTVEFVAVGVGGLMLLTVGLGWSYVPPSLVRILPFLPMVVSASIILGRIIHDGDKVDESPTRFENIGTSAVTSICAITLFGMGMFFFNLAGASSAPVSVALIAGIFVYVGVWGIRSVVRLV